MSGSGKRVAVVSGGSRGLGLGICETLLADGYCVATFSRRQSAELDQLCAAHRERLYWAPLDVTDDTLLAAYLQRVRERFGRVGYLVNSAGIAHEGLLTLARSEDVTRMLAVNLGGAIRLAQQCVKQMMVGGAGAIVNVSSVVGVRGYKGVGAYSATKAALDGLTRSLAKELGSLGIRVNSVAPGFMDTAMAAGLGAEQRDRLVRQTPLGRLGTIDDVAEVVKFLLSDAARFVTGQTVVVDGGLTT